VVRAHCQHAANGPRHLTSGRRFRRLHHNLPCSGYWARESGTNLNHGDGSAPIPTDGTGFIDHVYTGSGPHPWIFSAALTDNADGRWRGWLRFELPKGPYIIRRSRWLRSRSSPAGRGARPLPASRLIAESLERRRWHRLAGLPQGQGADRLEDSGFCGLVADPELPPWRHWRRSGRGRGAPTTSFARRPASLAGFSGWPAAALASPRAFALRLLPVPPPGSLGCRGALLGRRRAM
jgi:hypothetical protein